MPHVRITAPHPTGGKGQVIVDGVDVSAYLQAEPFKIDLGDRPKGVLPSVVVAIRADVLEVDLPEALLNAVAVTDEEA